MNDNMDYRLDLANSVERFQDQMTDEDALFIICNNTKHGDLLIGLDGNVDIISAVMANDNGYVNIETREQHIRHKQCQSMVLNIAINILRSDKDMRIKFGLALESLDNPF